MNGMNAYKDGDKNFTFVPISISSICVNPVHLRLKNSKFFPLKSALSTLLALLTPLAAFSPELHLIEPRGGQRGTEVEVKFLGKRGEQG